ncbi:DUF192 domain-containing protein [Pontiellaceae bacterium B12219]|nr:DUF192 domain-containing protein [Pontiellaceae bacterium B12219]
MSRILMKSENRPVLIETVLFAESTAQRMKGLLGRSGLPASSGMLIRPCRSIHMWFMRFPIDAAFLDANLNVLKLSRGLKPWQLAFAPPRTHAVLETAAGVLDPVQVGDTLRLDE